MENIVPSEQTELEGYTKVCSSDDLKENQGKKYYVNDVEIALFRTGGEVYALSNICPHQHTALIYDGFIENGFVVCPAHGWMFSLKTGRMPADRKGLDAYLVKVFNGEVFVKVSKKELNW